MIGTTIPEKWSILCISVLLLYFHFETFEFRTKVFLKVWASLFKKLYYSSRLQNWFCNLLPFEMFPFWKNPIFKNFLIRTKINGKKRARKIVKKNPAHYIFVPADFHFAFNVHCHWIREFESMEKGVCHHSGPRISASHFHEFWHHFRPQDTPISVRELNRSVLIVWSFTRLDSHVKFTCNKKGASWIRKYKSCTFKFFQIWNFWLQMNIEPTLRK